MTVVRGRRGAAPKAERAARALDVWLQHRRGSVPDEGAAIRPHGAGVANSGTTTLVPGEPPLAKTAPGAVVDNPGEDVRDGSPAAPRAGGADLPLRLPHTDWLHHRLTVTGPADALSDFRDAASGAGMIPWRLDGDRLQEDLFHLLAAPPAPQRRRLSLAGARELARQLREAVELRHAAAARVGRSRACPFDLHALLPVPPDILHLGADHPDAEAWLWACWGTTEALRRVAVAPAPARRTPLPAGTAAVQLSFWSADWTPWRALAAVRARWPVLCFEVRPTYGLL